MSSCALPVAAKNNPPFHSSDRVQILIDELGRGTSNQEGQAIAWAVAEKLLSSSAYTIFVTHYPRIPELADIYPNVKNMYALSRLVSIECLQARKSPQSLPAER